MALDSSIVGGVTGNKAEVTASSHLKTVSEIDVAGNPANVGAVKIYCENDAGAVTGVPALKSLEIDADYRLRVSHDLPLDEEVFNYTAQNTGKHNYLTSAMINSWAAGQLTTNAASGVAVNTGSQFSTYRTFSNIGTTTLSADVEIGFSAQPATNTFVEFGLGLPATVLAAPSDGVFFRLSSAGLQGVASSNGTETSTGLLPLAGGAGVWVYQNNKKYQFICYMSAVEAQFWVNDGLGAVLLGVIPLPAGQGRINMATGVHFFVKHRIVGGAASGALQSFVGAYNVRKGGSNESTSLSTSGNRLYGSYQGLSGSVMGGLANYANNTNPVAAVPTNTTAALGSGLGGQFWETATLAANLDGIIASFQVPPATASTASKVFVLRGVSLSSDIQAAIVGGPFVNRYALAFGHSSVSLATAESASSKAPRRLALPPFKQVVTAAQAASTMVSQPGGTFVDFGDAPVFVNPGEFIQLVVKRLGTAATLGTIAHDVLFVGGWE